MWDELKIENLLEKKLIREFGKTKGKEIYSEYVVARKCLVTDVLDEIKAVEPNLTAHGSSHVADVLNRIHDLLGKDIDKITSVNLYCLCLSALFHDVGNILGRTDHNKKIADIYRFVRKGDERYRDEQYIVTRVCEAHCGCLEDGSRDTLKEVPESYPLHNKEVRLRMIAAILRLADELAEGPQRTSAYMVSKHGYQQDSMVHHVYALITRVFIDWGNGRIVITYSPEVKTINDDLLTDASLKLSELLDYIYKRIIKLDQERKYAKHYCGHLTLFKETSVQINFLFNGSELNTGLDKIILSDLVLPGDSTKTIPQRNREYEINGLISKIKEMTREGDGR